MTYKQIHVFIKLSLNFFCIRFIFIRKLLTILRSYQQIENQCDCGKDNGIERAVTSARSGVPTRSEIKRLICKLHSDGEPQTYRSFPNASCVA